MNGNLVKVNPPSGNNAKPGAGVLVGGYLFSFPEGGTKVIQATEQDLERIEVLRKVKVPMSWLTLADRFLPLEAKVKSLAKSRVSDAAKAALNREMRGGKHRAVGQ